MSRIQQITTKKDIIKGLIELGVKPGMILEVHTSLEKLGTVIGGAQTVVDALIEVVGEKGTLLMPLQARENSEPSLWENPSLAIELIEEVRNSLPPYHKMNSDASIDGAVVENLRRRNGTVVSNHPSYAYVAWGRYAKLLCNRHSLHFPLSEESPAARLYELKGFVLLLGMGYDACTAMHLGEYRSDCRSIMLDGAAVEIDGRRVWKKYLNLKLDPSDFSEVGELLEKMNEVTEINVGGCQAKLFRADLASATMARYLEKKTVYHYYR